MSTLNPPPKQIQALIDEMSETIKQQASQISRLKEQRRRDESVIREHLATLRDDCDRLAKYFKESGDNDRR